MNLDPYELDAQARNKDAKRDRTAKNKEVQKTQLPRTRLKANFTTYNLVTSSRLECLTEARLPQPVISLYINLTPDRLQRQKDVFLTVFNSLKHTAMQENQEYIESLPSTEQRSIEDDMWLVHHYLQEDFEATGAKSLAIFKSGQDLEWVFKLSTPGNDYLGIDPDPYTLPLMVNKDQQQNALVVQLEVNQATFFSYRSGVLRRLDSFKSQVPDLSIDVSRPNKVQRHNFDHLNRHLKDSCDRLEDLSRQHKLTDVVLIGDERVLQLFQNDCLSNAQQKQIIATLSIKPGSTDGEISEQVQQEIQKHEVAEEGYYLDMIQKEGNRDGVITGVNEVISAQNRHLIRSLVVDQDLKLPGYYCQYDRFISMDEGNCPLCDRSMDEIDNVIDKLVELASQYKVDYKIIRERSEDMEPYGGIVATMYEIQ